MMAARNDSHGNIEILLDGLDEVVKTDIGTSAKTGKPRAFFRGRNWVRRFFGHHEVRAGQKLALERLSERRYRLLHADLTRDAQAGAAAAD